MRMLKTRSRSQLLGQAIARKFSCIRKAECSWVLTFSCRFCGQDEEHDKELRKQIDINICFEIRGCKR
jgi:hypothetical protein